MYVHVKMYISVIPTTHQSKLVLLSRLSLNATYVTVHAMCAFYVNMKGR